MKIEKVNDNLWLDSISKYKNYCHYTYHNIDNIKDLTDEEKKKKLRIILSSLKRNLSFFSLYNYDEVEVDNLKEIGTEIRALIRVVNDYYIEEYSSNFDAIRHFGVRLIMYLNNGSYNTFKRNVEFIIKELSVIVS